MMMKKILFILLWQINLISFSQDTLVVMHYNLLNFGNNTGYCNQSNNNYIDKTEKLKTILEYVKPDIFTVNEISNASLYHDYILLNALNVNGITFYQKGDPPNYSSSNIINQIFYNAEKLTLTSSTSISTNYRDIDIFKLKYSPPGQQNTTNLNCVVAHLKAGDNYEDEVERASEVNKLMNYLNNINAAGNYTMSGDFNVYTASEPAFQNLLFHSNESIRFYDPINQIGSWNNNAFYAAVHTQSTHTSGSCFSGGGMDDRFDFILVSDEILNASDGMKYLSGSYKAVGQDGQHFNSSIVSDPQNTSVPDNVLSALYGVSDHLPVILKLLVGENLGEYSYYMNNYEVSIENPVKQTIDLTLIAKTPVTLDVVLINSLGNHIFYKSFQIGIGMNHIEIPAMLLKSGLYLIKLSSESDGTVWRKIMKL